MQLSKQQTREYRRVELDIRAKLEVVTAQLHEDFYNTHMQGEVSELRKALEEIDTRKVKGAYIRFKVK